MENDTMITYICDRKACVKCTYPDCKHTADIRHAVNFKLFYNGKRTYFEETAPEGFPMAFELLSKGAKSMILKDPMFLNQLCERYERLLDDSVNDMFDQMV